MTDDDPPFEPRAIVIKKDPKMLGSMYQIMEELGRYCVRYISWLNHTTSWEPCLCTSTAKCIWNNNLSARCRRIGHNEVWWAENKYDPTMAAVMEFNYCYLPPEVNTQETNKITTPLCSNYQWVLVLNRLSLAYGGNGRIQQIIDVYLDACTVLVQGGYYGRSRFCAQAEQKFRAIRLPSWYFLRANSVKENLFQN